MGHKSAPRTISNYLGCVLTHYPLSRWFIGLIWKSTIIVHFDLKTGIFLPPLDLEMEPGEGLNGIPGWSVGVLEGITMSHQVKKVILPTYNLHTAFPPSAHFLAKVAYFQTP